MKSLWIRVDAHKVDSPEVCELADALGIDPAHALGCVVALGGAVAEHVDDGNIAAISDTALERWARWSGKRGAFAPALRRAFQSADGEYDNWHDGMGQLVERRARDRVRKTGGDSTEIPRKPRGASEETRRDSAATERDVTERNGTEDPASNSSPENFNTRSGDLHRDALRARERAELPAPLASAIADSTEEQRHQIADWLDAFYPDDNRRRHDVANQLWCALDPRGARLSRGQVVRAHSVGRLAAKCAEVRREGVHKRDRAIVVLLKKLGDTSDGSAPGQRQAEAEQQQSAIDDDANNAELTAALLWLSDHPDIVGSIDRQLALEYPAGNGKLLAAARAIAREQRIRDAYREHLEPAHA